MNNNTKGISQKIQKDILQKQKRNKANKIENLQQDITISIICILWAIILLIINTIINKDAEGFAIVSSYIAVYASCVTWGFEIHEWLKSYNSKIAKWDAPLLLADGLFTFVMLACANAKVFKKVEIANIITLIVLIIFILVYTARHILDILTKYSNNNDNNQGNRHSCKK